MGDVEFDCAPILLIGFNRPERLAAQVERLRAVKPRQLFIAVDGPRADKLGEAEVVARTREAAKIVDWPCELRTRFLDENHGCRFAPPEAISWMFESVEAGIVLEDDCVPTVEFLRYATDLLERYKNDSRVGMISGDNFYGFQSNKEDSYHFSRHVHIWGWATWRRSWRLYDGSMQCYQTTVDAIMHNPHPTKFERYWRKYLKGVLENPTTWDIQWCVAVAANRLLVVAPRVNLVSNIGHEAGALHTGGFVYDEPHYRHVGPLDFPMNHPQTVSVDRRADCKHENRSAGYLPRTLTVVGAIFSRVRPLGFVFDVVCVPLFRFVERVLPGLFRL